MGSAARTRMLLGFWCFFSACCVPGQGLLAAFAPAVKHHCFKAALILPIKRHPRNAHLFLVPFAAFLTLLLHSATLKAPRESPPPSCYLFICPGTYTARTNSHQPWAGVVRALPVVGRLSCNSGGSTPGSRKPCGQFGKVALCG